MTTSTPTTMLTRLATLNALPRRKRVYAQPMTIEQGRPLYTFDLLTLEQARAAAPAKAALADWSADAVFVRVDTIVDLYRSCTRKGRLALLEDELIGGWFAEQDAEFDDHGQLTNADEVGCDADAEFCSTPCHSYDEDTLPTIAEFKADLDDCSQEGVLFLY